MRKEHRDNHGREHKSGGGFLGMKGINNLLSNTVDSAKTMSRQTMNKATKPLNLGAVISNKYNAK